MNKTIPLHALKSENEEPSQRKYWPRTHRLCVCVCMPLDSQIVKSLQSQFFCVWLNRDDSIIIIIIINIQPFFHFKRGPRKELISWSKKRTCTSIVAVVVRRKRYRVPSSFIAILYNTAKQFNIWCGDRANVMRAVTQHI